MSKAAELKLNPKFSADQNGVSGGLELNFTYQFNNPRLKVAVNTTFSGDSRTGSSSVTVSAGFYYNITSYATLEAGGQVTTGSTGNSFGAGVRFSFRK